MEKKLRSGHKKTFPFSQIGGITAYAAVQTEYTADRHSPVNLHAVCLNSVFHVSGVMEVMENFRG